MKSPNNPARLPYLQAKTPKIRISSQWLRLGYRLFQHHRPGADIEAQRKQEERAAGNSSDTGRSALNMILHTSRPEPPLT